MISYFRETLDLRYLVDVYQRTGKDLIHSLCDLLFDNFRGALESLFPSVSMPIIASIYYDAIDMFNTPFMLARKREVSERTSEFPIGTHDEALIGRGFDDLPEKIGVDAVLMSNLVDVYQTSVETCETITPLVKVERSCQTHIFLQNLA